MCVSVYHTCVYYVCECVSCVSCVCVMYVMCVHHVCVSSVHHECECIACVSGVRHACKHTQTLSWRVTHGILSTHTHSIHSHT